MSFFENFQIIQSDSTLKLLFLKKRPTSKTFNCFFPPFCRRTAAAHKPEVAEPIVVSRWTVISVSTEMLCAT